MLMNSPEPQENVDFFIDDILGKHTQTIFIFNSSWWTIFVEGTFGHLIKEIFLLTTKILFVWFLFLKPHLWKDLSHWIHSVFNGLFTNGQHFSSISCELASKKLVHQINLRELKPCGSQKYFKLKKFCKPVPKHWLSSKPHKKWIWRCMSCEFSDGKWSISQLMFCDLSLFLDLRG